MEIYKEAILLKLRDIETALKTMDEEIVAILNLHQAMKNETRRLTWHSHKLKLIKEEMKLIKNEVCKITEILEEK